MLSQRLDFKPPAEPFQIYRALRTVNPSPYMYFLKLDDIHVVGASPEMLVRVSGRKLEYRPIAGTRKRGADPVQDEQFTEELRTDEKERAEHFSQMLVDLGRTDLGRVSEYGSVKVRDLMYVEKYSHVMHLVSALEGRSRRGDLDALRGTCWQLELSRGDIAERRSQGAGAWRSSKSWNRCAAGPCGGSVLYADYAGNLDSCIAIRTMACAWRSRLRAGRSGDRRRFRSGKRISGVHEQGQSGSAGLRERRVVNEEHASDRWRATRPRSVAEAMKRASSPGEGTARY